MRSGLKHSQSCTVYHIRCCSGRKSDIIARFVSLTSSIDSTIAFTSAFSLEALLFSKELWTRLPVAIVLGLMALLISWCIWTSLEAKVDFSVFEQVHVFKDRLVKFTRSLRGKTSEPGVEAGNGEDDDDRDPKGILSLLGRHSRPQKPRVSTSSTLVNQTGSSGQCSTPGETTLEMNSMNKKGPGNAV